LSIQAGIVGLKLGRRSEKRAQENKEHKQHKIKRAVAEVKHKADIIQASHQTAP
jgi:guanylate kinase